MNILIKALIRTLVEFVIILIGCIFTLGLVKYIGAVATFAILLLACFLLTFYINYKNNDYL